MNTQKPLNTDKKLTGVTLSKDPFVALSNYKSLSVFCSSLVPYTNVQLRVLPSILFLKHVNVFLSSFIVFQITFYLN